MNRGGNLAGCGDGVCMVRLGWRWRWRCFFFLSFFFFFFFFSIFALDMVCDIRRKP